MSARACAALVQRADPERFAATMMARPIDRFALFAIYAFNLELARVPWITAEPMIARMRFQWWRDIIAGALKGAPAPAHEIALPLTTAMRAEELPPDPLVEMIDGRERELDPEGLADHEALWAYLGQTGGSVMWVAGRALGADLRSEAVYRGFGTAAGAANLIAALPALRGAGRAPVDTAGGVEALATRAAFAAAEARAAARSFPKRVLPALWAGWQTDRILAAALEDPGAALTAPYAASPARRPVTLALWSLIRRW